MRDIRTEREHAPVERDSVTPSSAIRTMPWRVRAYIVILGGAAALTVAVASHPAMSGEHRPARAASAIVLVAVAGFYVESSRWLAQRFGYVLQPHRALSAWAVAAAVLLPPWSLLLIVPATIAHARLRDPSMTWDLRWIPSSLELVLCGAGAAIACNLTESMSTRHTDSVGLVTISGVVAAAAAFLATETVCWLAARSLRVRDVRWWVRARRLSPAGTAGEIVSLVAGMGLAAVWNLGTWLGVFVIVASLATQHAVLVLPLRSRKLADARFSAENARLAAKVGTLEAHNAELDELNRFKTDLMSMLGHEISNPLTSVLGFSQIGLAPEVADDPEAMRKALVVVDRNAKKVADVLADVRQLVASERSTITAFPEVIPLEPRLRAAIFDRPRSNPPELRCPPGATARVQPSHLDQIIANLLSNASKYAGGAKRVVVDSKPDHPWVTVTISDTGPGVPEIYRDKLFDRFWRDPEIAGSVVGTGIGLFVSRELARANGGDLTHCNLPDAGSEFILTLAVR